MERRILLYGMSDYAYEIRDLLALLPEIEMAGYVTSRYDGAMMVGDTRIYTAEEACRTGYEIILSSPVHFPSMAALLDNLGYDRYYEDLGAFLTTLNIEQRLRLSIQFKETKFNLSQLYYLHDIICIEDYFARIQRNERSNLLVEFQNELKCLEKSNGTRYYQKQKVKIGVICDKRFYEELEPSAECFLIEDLSVDTTLDSDILFITNASIDQKQDDLKKIIQLYRNKGTKTVYYSFDDSLIPAYAEIARLCQYILTTNAETLDKIKEACPESLVFFADHFINPLQFNPIGCISNSRRDSVFYRGMFNLPKKQEVVLESILDASIEADKELTILAEHYSGEVCSAPIPRKYAFAVTPDIEKEYNDHFYKLFRYVAHIEDYPVKGALKTNTLLRLQAQSCYIFTNYSREILNQFPNVNIANTKQDVIQHLKVFTKDDTDEQALYGVRSIMKDYTCFKRIEEILEILGIEHVRSSGKVAVIGRDKSKAYEMFEQQLYDEKYFFDQDNMEAFEMKAFDYITFFDETYKYDEFYLQDMINAFIYTDVTYVTKDENKEHRFVNGYGSKYKTVFWRGAYHAVDQIENAGVGYGYSTDRFEFSKEEKAYAYKERDYKISVAVPIYNSGRFLLNKTFSSFRRSTFFNELEIILTDDGSTDGLTPTIVRRLGKKHDNVKVILLKDKSGSASVPRNEGLYAASAEYFIFIDSDDEVTYDAFETLYREIIKGYEVVWGQFNRIHDTDPRTFFYPVPSYQRTVQLHGINVVTDGQQWVRDSAFECMFVVLTALTRRDFLLNNKIAFVPHVIGEDYIYAMEVLLKTTNAKILPNIVYNYYSQRNYSVMKTKAITFFKGCYLLEKLWIFLLKETNNFEFFIHSCFETMYFKTGYYYNLSKALPEEFDECLDITLQVLELYIDYIQNEDIINFYNALKNKDNPVVYLEIENKIEEIRKKYKTNERG